jgi:hypothetical protein
MMDSDNELLGIPFICGDVEFGATCIAVLIDVDGNRPVVSDGSDVLIWFLQAHKQTANKTSKQPVPILLMDDSSKCLNITISNELSLVYKKYVS